MALNRKISSILIIICINFVFLELIARYSLSSDQLANYFRSPHSHWRRIQWIKRTKDIPKEEYSTNMGFDKELGWRYKADLKLEDYFGAGNVMSTNSLGYRNKFDFSKDHKELVYLLGDSYVFGEETDDRKIFSYLLNQNSDIKYYNLGVSAYGHDQMLLTYKRYSKEYKAKRVLLFFNFTDLERNILSFHDYFKPYYTWENNQLKLNTEHIIKREAALKEEFYRLKLFEVYPILKERWGYNSKENTEKKKFIAHKIIKELSLAAKKNETELNLIYMPISTEANSMKTSSFKYEKFMYELCEKLKLKCFSANAEFRQIKNEFAHTFEEKAHWRERGHLAMYRAVKRIMKELNND